jgi:predicted DNA-binding protein with PD1-like motif
MSLGNGASPPAFLSRSTCSKAKHGMRGRLLHEADGQRTFVVILDTGDEVLTALKAFADRERLQAASMTAIGALRDAVLGYFDWERKEYQRNPINEQVEVAAFIGDIAFTEDDKRSLHIHTVLGRRDGGAYAGHLMEAHVRPTLEVMLIETPTHMRKRHDPESGLALIDPDARR